MKKLLSLLAAVALFPVAANADVLQNVNLKGDIQVITSDVNHNTVAPNLYNTATTARVLAGISADLVEDVTANLTFQYANIWGNDPAIGNNVQTYWNNVRLVEANVVLHNLFCCLEATVGRQFYGDEDSAVIYFGPNHYNAEANGYARSIDAAKLTYGDDVKALTLLAGRVNETTFGVLGPDHFDLFGVDFRMNLTDTLTAQVYGYDIHNQDGNVGVYDDHRGIYGAKLSLNTPVRLSAEYARNFGGHRLIKEHNKADGGKGQMIKVDAATDLDAFTVRGTFYYANETFFAYGNYTPGLLIGHPLAGQIDNYSINGVALFNLGFDVKPAEKWTVSLDGYSFQDHRMKHSSTWEADLTAKYDHNEYVQLFAGVGYAKYTGDHGTAFNKAALDSDNYKGQLGMLIKF